MQICTVYTHKLEPLDSIHFGNQRWFFGQRFKRVFAKIMQVLFFAQSVPFDDFTAYF